VPLIAATVVALICVLIVTALPVPTGDLFVALAGGRDVLAGRLGSPTTGRSPLQTAWVSQNWGDGLLFICGYALAGRAARGKLA
jgi:hypothetical protein